MLFLIEEMCIRDSVYIEDSHGQVVQKTFSFQNDRGEEDLPIEAE